MMNDEGGSAAAFDLLLSDLGLPDGSGLDVMRQLKAQGRSIPAIALSGFGMEEDVRKSKEAGFLEHLTKPVDLKRLQATLARLIGAPTPQAPDSAAREFAQVPPVPCVTAITLASCVAGASDLPDPALLANRDSPIPLWTSHPPQRKMPWLAI